jgi:hypothetical protein
MGDKAIRSLAALLYVAHVIGRLPATFRHSSDAAGSHLSVEFTLDNRRS